MAVYDLEEQEQLDELRTWWKLYGNLVTAVVLVVVLAASGWIGWKTYQRNQAAQASMLYSGLQQAASAQDANRVKSLAGELIEKYSSSTFAAMGVLVSARAQVDAGDTKTARAQLTWATENAGDEGLRDLARLRLAIILIDEKDYTEAAKQLAKDPAPAFLARFGELRGDLLAAQGKNVEARAAYETAIKDAEAQATALNAAPASRNYRDMLRAKLEHAGGAK